MRANELCAILGNVHEYQELLPLTEKRPLATLPFDCKYRIIDFNLSNAINANVKSVYMVFNQGVTQSLFDHIGGGREWHLDSVQSRFFVHLFQDFLKKKAEGKPYYEAAIDYLQKSKSEYTVFMGNKMICSIDLKAVLKIHQQHESNLTVVYKKMPRTEICEQDTILDLAEGGHVTGSHTLKEHTSKTTLENLSMNIYVMRTEWLINALKEGQTKGTPVSIQAFLDLMITQTETTAYEYTGFLSNVFDIPSYYNANMAMLDSKKFTSLLYSNQKIYTKLKNEVPTYYAPTSDVKNAQFATGCIVEGKVRDSLFSRSATIEKGADVLGAVVMANSTIKENVQIKYAILDKNVVIEPGVKVIGSKENPVVIKKGSHVIADVYGGEI